MTNIYTGLPNEITNMIMDIIIKSGDLHRLIKVNKYYNNYKYFKIYKNPKKDYRFINMMRVMPNFHYIKKIEIIKKKCGKIKEIPYYLFYTGDINDVIDNDIIIPPEIFKKIKILDLRLFITGNNGMDIKIGVPSKDVKWRLLEPDLVICKL